MGGMEGREMAGFGLGSALMRGRPGPERRGAKVAVAGYKGLPI